MGSPVWFKEPLSVTYDGNKAEGDTPPQDNNDYFFGGIVTVTGTFTLSANDMLEMELFSDNDYDKFIIEDDAQINDVELKIILAGGYKAEAGTRFTIFTSPNDPGKFLNPTLIKTNGHYFLLSYEENTKNGGYDVVLTTAKRMFNMEIRQEGYQ